MLSTHPGDLPKDWLAKSGLGSPPSVGAIIKFEKCVRNLAGEYDEAPIRRDCSRRPSGCFLVVNNAA